MALFIMCPDLSKPQGTKPPTGHVRSIPSIPKVKQHLHPKQTAALPEERSSMLVSKAPKRTIEKHRAGRILATRDNTVGGSRGGVPVLPRPRGCASPGERGAKLLVPHPCPGVVQFQSVADKGALDSAIAAIKTPDTNPATRQAFQGAIHRMSGRERDP